MLTESGGYELDVDTALAAVGEGRYEGRLTGRWHAASGLNGGYIAAVLLRAAARTSPRPDPLVMSISYLERPEAGPCEVSVEVLRAGRSHWTALVRLAQERPRAIATVTFGTRRAPGPGDFQAPAPRLPVAAECVPALRRTGSPLLERLDYRVDDPDGEFFPSAPESDPGQTEVTGWVRLADGRPPDDLAVPLYADCWPPAVLGRRGLLLDGGVPTIELTVQWRGAVGAGWHLARMRTRNLGGGYLEEDGEIWDDRGHLVALSRQLALASTRS